MTECFNIACPYCMDYQCRRTCTCDMRLDGEYVKVVRCKDCAHATLMSRGYVCNIGDKNRWRDDFFCGDGERRTYETD